MDFPESLEKPWTKIGSIFRRSYQHECL